MSNEFVLRAGIVLDSSCMYCKVGMIVKEKKKRGGLAQGEKKSYQTPPPALFIRKTP